MQVDIAEGIGTGLHVGVLLDETCRDDTGGDGNYADAEEGDADCHDAAEDGDGVDVAVTDSEQGADAPPDAGEDITKGLGLGFVLCGVHAEGGCHHEDEDDENGRQELVLLLVEDSPDDIEGVVVGVDAEEVKDSDHTEHAEGDETGQVVEGQNGQKLDDAVKTNDEVPSSLPTGF